jgi:hypothetical protein
MSQDTLRIDLSADADALAAGFASAAEAVADFGRAAASLFSAKRRRADRCLLRKKFNRHMRRTRKDIAARPIPHLGFVVSKAIVKNHRYLRAHGLPHSPSIANVYMPSRSNP